MSNATHLGEFEDGKLYTDQRAAQIMQRTRDWVLQNYIFPVNDRGEDIPGVPCRKVGSLYQFTGEDIRLWVQQFAKPQQKRAK